MLPLSPLRTLGYLKYKALSRGCSPAVPALMLYIPGNSPSLFLLADALIAAIFLIVN